MQVQAMQNANVVLSPGTIHDLNSCIEIIMIALADYPKSWHI